ncbi:MAG: hypothetical protein M3325_04350, partial [Actinomycetota bacterium]|nr:hypothetical protein [Actinomycetota bacterium]
VLLISLRRAARALAGESCSKSQAASLITRSLRVATSLLAQLMGGVVPSCQRAMRVEERTCRLPQQDRSEERYRSRAGGNRNAKGDARVAEEGRDALVMLLG